MGVTVTKRFLEPYLDTMANGQMCLRLAAETTWAEFDQVAPLVIRALNATLGEKLDGVDVRLWEADIDDTPFYVAWDHWMGLSLEPRDTQASEAMPALKKRLQALPIS